MWINTKHPYFRLMRLHQPTGIWLLLWPCWWAIILAAENARDLILLPLFLLGALIMRSAGCVINDMWDKQIDAQVKRTKHRPLASGELNIRQAFNLLAALSFIGLIILLNLNTYTLGLGIIFAVLLVIYPLMKRMMRVPQFFLGITFNAGALMGWSAVKGDLSLIPCLLYAACFCWTLGYDTIYAHQDKFYDAKLGINSSALAFGDATKRHISFYYFLMLLLLLSIGVLAARSWFYYSGLFVFFTYSFLHLIQLKLNDAQDCFTKFRAHGLLGGIIFLGMLIDSYYK